MRRLKKTQAEELAAAQPVIAELASTVHDAHMAADAWYDDRSERWQESARGEAYLNWTTRLEQLADDLDELIEQLADLDQLVAPGEV